MFKSEEILVERYGASTVRVARAMVRETRAAQNPVEVAYATLRGADATGALTIEGWLWLLNHVTKWAIFRETERGHDARLKKEMAEIGIYIR